jgi:hypothetical protein
MNAVVRPETQISKQLRWALHPIQHILDDRSVTDIHINGAGDDETRSSSSG